MNRQSLPADPAAAYAAAVEAIASNRRDRTDLLALRDRVLREWVAAAGYAAVGRALSPPVTDSAVRNKIAKALERAVTSAAAEVGADAATFTATPVSGGVALTLADAEPHQPGVDAGWVGRMNFAAALFAALTQRGVQVDGDGLAVEVDGRGPRAALAEGRACTARWA